MFWSIEIDQPFPHWQDDAEVSTKVEAFAKQLAADHKVYVSVACVDSFVMEVPYGEIGELIGGLSEQAQTKVFEIINNLWGARKVFTEFKAAPVLTGAEVLVDALAQVSAPT